MHTITFKVRQTIFHKRFFGRGMNEKEVGAKKEDTKPRNRKKRQRNTQNSTHEAIVWKTILLPINIHEIFLHVRYVAKDIYLKGLSILLRLHHSINLSDLLKLASTSRAHYQSLLVYLRSKIYFIFIILMLKII